MNVIQHAWVSFMLSVAETLILYWLCSNFLHRNLRPMSQYTVGILIYFIFQWSDSTGSTRLCSACAFLLRLHNAGKLHILYRFPQNQGAGCLSVRCPQLCLQAAVRSAVAFLHNEPLPSEPNFLIQSPLAQMTACILFFLSSSPLLFILCRNMRKSNKATLYNAISFLVPSVILFITIQIFHMRNSVSHFYLEISGNLFLLPPCSCSIWWTIMPLSTRRARKI